MLTAFTQPAIAVLDSIYTGTNTSITESYGFFTSKQSLLLHKPEAAGLTCLYAKENPDKSTFHKPTDTSLAELKKH